ncbi:MAG TPA: carboxymuconolactone decarboxylase family protein [Mitsuokella multacida]|nr:carboxymuconolactone decarboxylase family protein [Mitsuokella multacida]
MVRSAAIVLLSILFGGTGMVQSEAASAQSDNGNAAAIQASTPAPAKKAVKIVQTAGRQQLGDFAPDFARYNDDILFGEVWSKNDVLSLHDRSIVTVSALIAQGITDSSLKYHIESAKKNGVTKAEMAEIITQVGFYGGWPKAWAAFRYAKEVYQEPAAK